MGAVATAPFERFDSADLRLPHARDGARAPFGLVERGAATVEDLRELIGVPPSDEQRLRRIAEIEPELAHCVLPVLRFCGSVFREFEMLVAEANAFPVR